MNRSISVMFFFLFLFSSIAFADNLSCQYKEKVIDKEEIKMLPFDNNGTQLFDVVIEVPNEYDRPIKAMNPNNVNVSGYVDIFVLAMNSNAGFIPTISAYECDSRASIFRKYNFTIPAYSFIEIYQPSNSIPAGTGYCNIYKFKNNYTLTYYNTDLVTFKPTKITTYKDVCRQCGGRICANDGEKCIANSTCGSNICNIAGFCDTKLIVPCPNDLLNCNNQSCVEPSVKETGQAYSCEFECKSGRGETGVCKRAQIWDYLYVAFFVIIGVVLLFKGYEFYVKTIIRIRYEKLKLRIDELEVTLREITARQEGFKLEADKERREIEKLEEQIKKKKLSGELLEKANKEVEDKRMKLAATEANWRNDLAKQKEKKAELEVLIKEMADLEVRRQKPYPNEEGYLVWRNPKFDSRECRYKSFWNRPSEELFHIWWYNKNTKPEDRVKQENTVYNIHHIDGDKYNNNISNLIRLTKEQHDCVHKSGKIIVGDHASGIQALRSVGVIDIPERNLKKK